MARSNLTRSLYRAARIQQQRLDARERQPQADRPSWRKSGEGSRAWAGWILGAVVAMRAKDFRLYSAKTKRRKLAIYVSIARVRAVLAARLTTAALKGQLHHFEITTADETRHFWGIPDNQ